VADRAQLGAGSGVRARACNSTPPTSAVGIVPVTSRFVHASFFEPAGPGNFIATGATAGPWSPDAQHGGPPSALAARELERHEPDENMRLARVAVDILRPVPVGPLTASTRTLRPGKRVALLETVLESNGQPVLVARGWRITKLADGPVVTRAAAAPEIPAAAKPPRFPGGNVDGYLSHTEWRFEAGNFDEPGPCKAWARPRIPLLPGEEVSPMSRSLLLADSGNGVSMALDPRIYIFINVDLTVILHRDPAGEWLLLDAVTTMDGTGTGLAESTLSDTAGEIGVGVQTLLVSPR
jgi:Thioesterase-like superfamily